MSDKGGGNMDGLEDVADVQLKLGEEQNKLAREYLDFAKNQYKENQAFVKQVLDVQLPAMREQLANAREDRGRYEKFFAPLEEQFAREAKGYDTTARREAEAGKAQADVMAGQEAARENAAAQLESFGVDPSTTRAMAIDRQIANANAVTAAAAGNQARTRVEDTGRALRGQAINIGRGFPSQAAQGYGGAVQTGGAAVGTQQTPGAAMNQGAGVSQGFSQIGVGAIQGAAQTREALGNLQGQTPWLDAVSGVGGLALGGYLSGHEEGGLAGDTSNPPGPTDTMITAINPREYVLPEDVVLRKGTEFLDRFVESTRRKAIEPRGAQA